MSEQAVIPGSAHDVMSILKQNQASKYASDKAMSEVTKAGDFLPYIQVMGSNNDKVKAGDFPMGHFALMKAKVAVNLGRHFIGMMLSWRPKAMQYKPEVLSFYNPESEVFKKIEMESMQPRSNKGFGPEILFWLPDHSEFASLFLGNITGRVEAPNFLAALKEGKLATKVACELVEYKKQKNSYHGARYYPYDVPVTQLPDPTKLQEVLTKFNNPPETDKEPAEAAEASEADDRG